MIGVHSNTGGGVCTVCPAAGNMSALAWPDDQRSRAIQNPLAGGQGEPGLIWVVSHGTVATDWLD